MAQKILAVDDNAVNLKLVSAVLSHAGYEVYVASTGKEALQRIQENAFDLIILDVMMPEMDGYEVCRRIRALPKTAQVPIIMLTAHDSLEEKIRGFEAGADDYMGKPFQPAELQARVMVLLRRAIPVSMQKTEEIGKVIGVFSLRGGVGVSTLAANLAASLAQIWSVQAVLVDLSFLSGEAALLLNLPLRNTWSDLATMPIEEIEDELIDSVLLAHPAGVRVLAAPRRIDQSELITADKVNRVLDYLRKRYPYIVLDLPHDFQATTLAGLDAADVVIGMLSPELAAVRSTASMLDVFDTLEYPCEKTQLVLNWIFEKRGLARKDIENALKHPIRVVIPFASEVFVPAINLGVPPVMQAPGTPIASLLEDYAYILSKEEHLQNPPVQPTEAWHRVQQRNQLRQQR